MHNQKVLFTSIVLLSSFFTLKGVNAATINAASCSQANVQSAINSASAGDIVTVPAGSCAWSGGISLLNGKKITLMGAGMNSTIISGSLSFGTSGSRVTGFEFKGDPTIYSEGYGFRIDHCRIRRSSWGDAINPRNTSTTQAIPVSWGLIDNNEIINGRVNAEGTNAMFSDGQQQNVLWATTLDLGGETAIYIEDNTFTNPSGLNPCNFVDGNYGGRYVFRYNTTDGCALEAHSSQEGGNRGIRSWEIYGNIINKTGATMYMPFRIRAGTGTIFYNDIIGNWSSNRVGFDNVRSYAVAGFGGGKCNGSSKWDGNKDSFGYPCRDQIGRSADSPQWNHSSPGAYTEQYVPVYTWLNKSGATNIPVAVINSSENHIKPNRDYYDYNSAFNGASGTGCGTLAARPASCTTGVGYWATNQSCSTQTGMVGANPTNPISGTLYKCTATNEWTAHYTPYTYPHPLQGGSGTGTIKAPTNLHTN